MKLKKTFKRVLLLTAVFLIVVIAAVVTAIYQNRGRESQGTLQAASYPLIRLIYEGDNYHELHGYTEKMDPVSVRDSITPLNEDRTLTMRIETYGQQIRSVSYQIRSLDGSHLIEDTQVASFQQQENEMTANLQISNLIEENKEYILMVEVDTDSRPIYYYSRIIYGESMYTTELLNFVKEFSNATFDSRAGGRFRDSQRSADGFQYRELLITAIPISIPRGPW